MINQGLIGTFPLGVQALWPDAPPVFADFFDRPAWERPTADNPFVPPDAGEWDYSGTPGWGGVPDAFIPGVDGIGGGWSGFIPGVNLEWIPGDPADPADGGTVIAPGVPAVAIRAERLRFYRLEVYGVDGKKIASVPNWTSGRLQLQMDKASILTFTVPLGAEGLEELVRPNNVWLRDRWGFVVDTFQIVKRRPRGARDASYFDFECTGAVSQLGEEVVIEYSAPDPLPVADHVAALLALQGRGDALELGTVEPGRAMRFYAADTTIHDALLQLQLALPKAERGRLYVDPQRRLQWRTVVGDQTEQIITRAANVQSIQAETDYSQIVNRLFFYGEGNDPQDRLSLIDSGEPVEYVEDTDSQTQWGFRPMLKQDRRFRIPENLLLTANRILEEYAQPITTVEVDLLDVAKADNVPAGWADIYIGGKYRVQDTDLDIDAAVEIVGLEVNLARPVPVRVELTNQRNTLADLITRLYEATQQPLDVDGDRYPTMGRNYSARDARLPRAGDVRWNDAQNRAEMHDGDEWQPLETEADQVWYTATSYGGLEPASNVAETALGRVTAGVDQGNVYKINAANDTWVLFGSDVPVVTVLPAIPNIGMAEVFWTSTGAGTGDNQVWRAYAGQAAWTATQRFTTNSGAVI